MGLPRGLLRWDMQHQTNPVMKYWWLADLCVHTCSLFRCYCARLRERKPHSLLGLWSLRCSTQVPSHTSIKSADELISCCGLSGPWCCLFILIHMKAYGWTFFTETFFVMTSYCKLVVYSFAPLKFGSCSSNLWTWKCRFGKIMDEHLYNRLVA